MNVKRKNQVVTANIFEQQEITAKDEGAKSKFDKNEKFTFINDDMLILGCDVGTGSFR